MKVKWPLQGPRQDAGLVSNINMGVKTATAIYSYAQQQQSATRIVVTGLRKAEEVVALSGIDYMIVPGEIAKQLASRGTLDGYNDGLSAAAATEGSGIPMLSPEMAKELELSEQVVSGLSEKQFEEEMGMAGLDLLNDRLAGDCKVAERVESMLMSMVVARE
jgi:transaldolase